jgi:HEAT repeat protein
MPDAGSESAAVRRRAAALAGHAHDTATARALSADSDPSVRATAFAALERCEALDAASLVAGLGDRDATVRRRCATLAAVAPAKDRDVVGPALLSLLDDDEHLVAEAAAWSLGEWGTDNPRLDEALAVLATTTVEHSEPLCREAAVAALGAIGDVRGLPAVLHACDDKPAVRRRAVLALAPFDGVAVEAAIDRALTDRDWQVRQAAEDLRR